MLFYGYKLKGKSVKEIQSELMPVKSKIQEIADKTYHELIGKEAAFLGDCMTLNIMERNFEENYIQMAVNNVNFWIQSHNMKRLYGQYNYSIYAYFFEFKNHVYMRIDFKNPIFKDAFDGMEEVSISQMDYEMNHGFLSELWHAIVDSVKESDPISLNLSPDLQFKNQMLVFPSKELRISEWVRHQEINRIIDSMRFDQNPISPARMLPFVDYSFQTYIDKEKEESETGMMQSEKQSLRNLLLDFNEDKNKELLKPKKEDIHEDTKTDME